jgi:hypothetical protein
VLLQTIGEIIPQRYTLLLESRCALTLRDVDLAVSTKIAVEIYCCLTVFCCSIAVKCNTSKGYNCLMQVLLTMVSRHHFQHLVSAQRLSESNVLKTKIAAFSETPYIHPVAEITTFWILPHAYTVNTRVRQAWHTTNLGYDQNFCFDLRPNLKLRPAPAWRAHIRYHVQFTASARGVYFVLQARKCMYSINKYRVTEKGCVSLMARSSIN